MAEINEAGYVDIREHIEDTWIWIELRDELSEPIFRLSEEVDARVTWTHDPIAPGMQVLELTVELSGEDADITPPQTFAESAIYNVDTGGDAFAEETFTQFTIESEDDQLTIIHQIEVPEQTE